MANLPWSVDQPVIHWDHGRDGDKARPEAHKATAQMRWPQDYGKGMDGMEFVGVLILY